MKTHDSLGKLLQCWQVEPRRNPKLQAEVLERIHQPRRRALRRAWAAWFGWLWR